MVLRKPKEEVMRMGRHRQLSAVGCCRGSVLILALWTLFFLAALAMAIGSQVSAGLKQATVLREDLEAYAVARTGVATALAVLVADTNKWDSVGEEWGAQGVLGDDLDVGEGWVSLTHCVQSDGGTIVTNRGLSDEESRISINQADQPLLASLLEIAGRLDKDAAAAVARAILDWKDADDDGLTGKAERNYYATLGKGYTCHNGPFQAVEELCLVKGFSRELLDRVRSVVSLYGSGKININTAGPVVLGCLAHQWGADDDVAESVVDAVIAFRDAGLVFESARAPDMVRALDEFEALTAEESTLVKKMARSVQVGSGYYRGTVRSMVGRTGAATATIDFVFDRERQEKVYWYER